MQIPDIQKSLDMVNFMKSKKVYGRLQCGSVVSQPSTCCTLFPSRDV